MLVLYTLLTFGHHEFPSVSGPRPKLEKPRFRIWGVSESGQAGSSIQEGRFQHPGRPVSASGRGLFSHPGLGRIQNPGGARHSIQGSVVFTNGWWRVCERRGSLGCSASGFALKGVLINIISPPCSPSHTPCGSNVVHVSCSFPVGFLVYFATLNRYTYVAVAHEMYIHLLLPGWDSCLVTRPAPGGRRGHFFRC